MNFGLFTRAKPSAPPPPAAPSPRTPQRDYSPAEARALPEDTLARALHLHRYGHVLAHPEPWQRHPQIAAGLEQAARAIDDTFALVPDGIVTIPMTIFDQAGQPERDALVDSYLLARYCVTNAEYQCFVDDGGYEALEHWPEDIWPHLIDFQDHTGRPGPALWRDGRHDKRLAQHPVVGVCFYEAAAYASWAGYRLPSEAEWQMAAGWRLRTEAATERRYPWGDSLELDCCNIWSSDHGGTLPVDACPNGAASNGVRQLIGNVWEWTRSDFEASDREGRKVVGDMLLKVIRGGAFDTYFPWQATSNFRSGLACLARFHNVGFRCALNVPSSV